MVEERKEVKKRGRDDYIRIIYELDSEDGKGVKPIDIAKSLGIRKASVTEMVNKLANEKLVKTKPYANIFLTQKGKKTAESLSDRHKIIKEFLIKLLKFNDVKAYDEAHKLEHAFSDDTIEILKRMVEGKQIGTSPGYIG